MPVFSSKRFSRKWWIPAGTGMALVLAFFAMKEIPLPEGTEPVPKDRKATRDARRFPLPGGGDSGDSGIHAESRLSVQDVPKLSRSPMTPELARILLDRARNEVKDIRHRAAISSAILSALCAQGKVSEAWNLVEPGRGSVREAGIGAVFGSTDGSTDFLIGKLEALTEPRDRSRALEGLIRSRPAEIATLDFGGISLNSAAERRAVAAALTAAINQQSRTGAGDPEIVKGLLGKSVELFKDEKIGATALSGIFNGMDVKDPFHSWKLIAGLAETVEQEDLELLYRGTVQTMIRVDLERSMELITSNSHAKFSQPVIGRAVDLMYSMDPHNANRWITENLSRVDHATAQHLIASIARVAARSGETDTALRWAERLEDGDEKTKILEEILPSEVSPSP